MLKVTVSRKTTAVRIPQRVALAKFLSRVAEEAGLAARVPTAETAELRFVLVGAARMAAMNRRFLDHEGATDVLAFDLSGKPSPHMPDEPVVMGEVYVCPEVAVSASLRYGTTPEHELLLYMVHGALHLAGEDDHAPAGRKRMQRMQARLLTRALAGVSAEEVVRVSRPEA